MAFRYPDAHTEVLAELSLLGNASYGEAVRVDRGSNLRHLGIRFPVLRKRVKQGFSFTAEPPEPTLEIWDDLWQNSPCGDVLFAALEFYIPLVAKRMTIDLWPVASTWIYRIDNWCHSDQLSRVYSHLLERDFDRVYPHIVAWNQSDGLWQRRTSLVSLIHYTGKNAVFLPPDKVLPLVENCLDDQRHYVQTAIGWVLKETSRKYPHDVSGFISQNSNRMARATVSRATELL